MDRLSIRPCHSDDAEILFAWRNNPEIIAHSTNKVTVTWGEHSLWLANSLQCPDRHQIYIAEISSVPVGMARFEIDQRGIAIISAYLDPSRKGHGLGPQMIRNATNNILDLWESVPEVNAEILTDNKRARRGFAKAGYVEQGTSKLDGHMLYVFAGNTD